MPKSQQPLSGMQKVLDRIKQSDYVLDIGAGTDAKWGNLLFEKVAHIDAVEAWPENAAQCVPFYQKVYNVDVRQFQNERTYDVAILGDVLEHLPYEDAIALVARLKMFCMKIFLILPVTVCIQDGNVLGNPYETHLYHWSDKEVRDVLGFELLNVGVNDLGLVAIGTYIWQK